MVTIYSSKEFCIFMIGIAVEIITNSNLDFISLFSDKIESHHLNPVEHLLSCTTMTVTVAVCYQ
jgi:hypothetical protein